MIPTTTGGTPDASFVRNYENDVNSNIPEDGDRELEMECLCGSQCLKNPELIYNSVTGTSTETPIMLNQYPYVSYIIIVTLI